MRSRVFWRKTRPTLFVPSRSSHVVVPKDVAPVLTFLRDLVVDTAGGGRAQVATGTGFGASSVIKVGGEAQATTYDAGTGTLSCTMPAHAADAAVPVTVANGAAESEAISVMYEADPLFWLAGDNATAEGGVVSAVADVAGGVFDLAQATEALRPALVAADAAFNGQPTISHEDTSLWLDSAIVDAQAQPFAIYGVVTLTDSTRRFLLDSVGVGDRVAVITVGASYIDAYAGVDLIGSGAPGLGVAYAFCCVYNGASSAVYINDPATAKVTGNSGAGALSSLRLGTRSSGAATDSFRGRWGTVGGFAGAPDEATRTRIMGALKTKYGLA